MESPTLPTSDPVVDIRILAAFSFILAAVVVAVFFRSDKKEAKKSLAKRTGTSSSEFERAAAFLSSADVRLSTDQQLALYALYKQATVGECNKEEPSKLDLAGHAKWSAWKKLGSMAKDRAEMAYVLAVTALVPAWASSKDAGAKKRGGGGSGGAGGMAPRMSMMVESDDDDDKLGNQLFSLVAEGKVEQVIKALKTGRCGDIKAHDENGNTLLHLAADRGLVSLCEALLEKDKSLLEMKDDEESTPLHVATFSENVDVVKLLLKHKADVHAKDDSGSTCLDLAADIGGDILKILSEA